MLDKSVPIMTEQFILSYLFEVQGCSGGEKREVGQTGDAREGSDSTMCKRGWMNWTAVGVRMQATEFGRGIT